MMNIGVKYVDMMDQTRTLVPLAVDGTCDIFFDGVYVGKAKAPVTLFANGPDDHGASYSFVPEAALHPEPSEASFDDEELQ